MTGATIILRSIEGAQTPMIPALAAGKIKGKERVIKTTRTGTPVVVPIKKRVNLFGGGDLNFDFEYRI